MWERTARPAYAREDGRSCICNEPETNRRPTSFLILLHPRPFYPAVWRARERERAWRVADAGPGPGPWPGSFPAVTSSPSCPTSNLAYFPASRMSSDLRPASVRAGRRAFPGVWASRNCTRLDKMTPSLTRPRTSRPPSLCPFILSRPPSLPQLPFTVFVPPPAITTITHDRPLRHRHSSTQPPDLPHCSHS